MPAVDHRHGSGRAPPTARRRIAGRVRRRPPFAVPRGLRDRGGDGPLQESGNRVDRPHGGRQPDALGSGVPGLPDQIVEARQRQREMRSPLVVRQGMNLVDDDGRRMTQRRAAAFRGQQDEQRLRRGDQNVRRPAHHPLALPGRGIAGADPGPDAGGGDAPLERQLLELGQRGLEVPSDVVAERLQRRDVDHLDPIVEPSGEARRHQPVETDEKGGEGLPGSGGSRHQDVAPGADGGPGFELRLGGGGEPPPEPLGGEGVKILHGGPAIPAARGRTRRRTETGEGRPAAAAPASSTGRGSDAATVNPGGGGTHRRRAVSRSPATGTAAARDAA